MVLGTILTEPGRNPSCIQSIPIWIHTHPTITKAIEIGGIILGTGLLLSACIVPPLALGVTITMITGGALLALVSAVAFLAIDLLIPPHHTMSDHAYEANSCEGGKLYYEGDVPILSLKSDDPLNPVGYLSGFSGEVKSVRCESSDEAKVLHLSEECDEAND